MIVIIIITNRSDAKVITGDTRHQIMKLIGPAFTYLPYISFSTQIIKYRVVHLELMKKQGK